VLGKITAIVKVTEVFWILGSHKGFIYSLMITPAALFVKLLGKTSSIQTMNRLGENTVFIGSHMGHHKILRLQNEFEDVIEVKTIDNLGPIVDIYVSEFEKHSEVVMCSGKDQDSSLKIVRKGITPKVEAKVPI